VIVEGSERLTDEIIIRAARSGEQDVVLDLLAEAAAWLLRQGIAQWPPRFPAESVRREIATGETLLVLEGTRPIATLTVADNDRDLWGARTEPAYYISRLAVARSARGRGLGYRLIDWVQAKAAARGWPFVRLATSRDNPALRRYYEEAGFRHVTDPPHARWPTSLYERALGHPHPTPREHRAPQDR